MTSLKKPFLFERPIQRQSRFAAASIFAALALALALAVALALTSTGSQAESNANPADQAASNITQSEQQESRIFDKNPNSHTIKLDNTKGTHTLMLREKFLSPQCITGVGANFTSLPPGSIGQIHVTEDDGILSGCRNVFEDKHVTLQFDATRAGAPALRYHIQFGVQDVPEVHGKVEIAERHVRILSSDFDKPGTPYKATCGRLECLNEWALDYDDKIAAIYFYPNGTPNPQDDKVAISPASE